MTTFPDYGARNRPSPTHHNDDSKVQRSMRPTAHELPQIACRRGPPDPLSKYTKDVIAGSEKPKYDEYILRTTPRAPRPALWGRMVRELISGPVH